MPALSVACGDSTVTMTTQGGSDSMTGTSPATAGTPTTDDSESEGTTEPGGSDSESVGTTTTTATTSPTTETGNSTGPETGEIKLDLGFIPDGGSVDCDGEGDDNVLFSNIWIANSGQGTVSKIDTETMVELGRYYTNPANGGGSPSRTSVNLQGDVAVVNRNGGIAKIAVTEEHCIDKNNDGEIQTSSGPNDLLPWDVEECTMWHTTLPSASRPAAWTSGEKIGEGCNAQYVDAKVWTSAPNGPDAFVYLINGEDGTIEGMVNVPGANGGLGIYGGAVDPNNDFWGVTYSQGPLVHVRLDDLTYETIPLPNPSAYGFTVDSKGRSWVGGWSGALQRYDPEDQSWTTAQMPGYSGLSRGMMEDQEGKLWIAGLSTNALLGVDTDSATLIDIIDAGQLVGVATPTGASVDFNGTVWMVDQSKDGGGAFVYEPSDQSVAWVGGLISPYTYSDMTGWALGNVANPNG